MKTREDLLQEMETHESLLNPEQRAHVVAEMFDRAARLDFPGQFALHVVRYGEWHVYPHPTLDEALTDAYWLGETNAAWPSCITRDGEVVAGGIKMVIDADKLVDGE